MRRSTFSKSLAAAVAFAFASVISISSAPADSPEEFRGEITALQPPKLVWREIDWNYCLLDGISKARAQKKPILLWSFINSDPAEERC